jgi:hypothetical protein
MNREEVIDYYGSKLKTDRFLLGYPYDYFPSPDTISSDELDTIIEYLTDSYNNDFKSSNWDQDLYAVMIGAKPCALIDNLENLIVPGTTPQEDIESYDSLMRMNFLLMGGRYMEIYKNTYDFAMIYYLPETWEYACILYLYHEKLLSYNLHRKARELFTEFQSILLGYNVYSTIIYESRVDTYLHNYVEEKTGRQIRLVSEARKEIKKISRDEWISIYRDLYEIWKDIEENMKTRYNRAQKLINHIKSKLTSEHKIAFTGEISTIII